MSLHQHVDMTEYDTAMRCSDLHENNLKACAIYSTHPRICPPGRTVGGQVALQPAHSSVDLSVGPACKGCLGKALLLAHMTLICNFEALTYASEDKAANTVA